MSDCLHCDINEMVQKHIESAENPDIADLVARIAESLADTILNFVPEEDQATVLAHSVAHLARCSYRKVEPRRATPPTKRVRLDASRPRCPRNSMPLGFALIAVIGFPKKTCHTGDYGADPDST